MKLKDILIEIQTNDMFEPPKDVNVININFTNSGLFDYLYSKSLYKNELYGKPKEMIIDEIRLKRILAAKDYKGMYQNAIEHLYDLSQRYYYINCFKLASATK